VIYGLTQQFTLVTLGIKSFFILLWTMVLNALCSSGHKGISWLLVVLPYLFLGLSFLFNMDVLAMGGGINREGYKTDVGKSVGDNTHKLPKRKGIGAVISQACTDKDIEKVKRGEIKSCQAPIINLGNMSKYATTNVGYKSMIDRVYGKLTTTFSLPSSVDAALKMTATPTEKTPYIKADRKPSTKSTGSTILTAALNDS